MLSSVLIAGLLADPSPAALSSCLAPAQDAAGIVPLGENGESLILVFDGTLRDWTAMGDAFEGQPIEGDTVQPRRGDSIEER